MKVLTIVEDHPIVISGCRALLLDNGDVVLLEALTVTAARSAVERETPDVIIIDIKLPDGSGLELTREIVSANPLARVVVFSMSDTPMLAIQAIESGAKGYVSKNANPLDLKGGCARRGTWQNFVCRRADPGSCFD